MAKRIVEEAILEDRKNIELEADEAFPNKNESYKFRLQNGHIFTLEDSWSDKDLRDFITLLRNTFFKQVEEGTSSRSVWIWDDSVPPVVRFKGKEIQIDNIPLASFLAYASSNHSTVGQIVTNVMRNERIRALYAEADTKEEFSDFVDDSEYESLTPFEKAMYEAEKQAEQELFQRIQSTSRPRFQQSETREAADISSPTPQESKPQASSASSTPPEQA